MSPMADARSLAALRYVMYFRFVDDAMFAHNCQAKATRVERLLKKLTHQRAVLDRGWSLIITTDYLQRTNDNRPQKFRQTEKTPTRPRLPEFRRWS